MLANCWITVNRECNLRCKWCYARPAGYSKAKQIDIDKYRDVLDILVELGIPYITLLGGEPTRSEDLLEIVRLATDHGISTTLVTNGLALTDPDYLDALVEKGLGSIDVSLKGSSEEQYRSNTGFFGYGAVMAAIANVASRDVRLSVSTVLSETSVHDYLLSLRDAREAGAQFFSLSFCYDFSKLSDTHRNDTHALNVHDEVGIIGAFEESYSELCLITDDRFSLMQSYPLCLWDPGVIKQMLRKGQVNSICQLLNHSGLVFDTDFSMIPCNAMTDIQLGRLGRDYFDSRSLLENLDSERVKSTLAYLSSSPSETCSTCELWPVCGGGCVSFWLNHTFEAIGPYRKEWGMGALTAD